MQGVFQKSVQTGWDGGESIALHKSAQTGWDGGESIALQKSAQTGWDGGESIVLQKSSQTGWDGGECTAAQIGPNRVGRRRANRWHGNAVPDFSPGRAPGAKQTGVHPGSVSVLRGTLKAYRSYATRVTKRCKETG
ncbi:hypothetical protein [Acanthopleuribacter pedis]|uniref:Uncharacterized protein n=1 Tax=Acanthopleuribacter pedis TaxID=442870 RepID=A0A8J7Q6Z4_9BACT|nr:hypothetical protein [Acanthopleuribacter pedis]MBO1319381.1 hypothetical protein [Acanthopleuribacter pedis]